MQINVKKLIFWNIYLFLLLTFFFVIDFTFTKLIFKNYFQIQTNKTIKQNQYWRVKNELYHHDFYQILM